MKTTAVLAVAALVPAPVAYADNHKFSAANAPANISVPRQRRLSYDAADVVNGQMQQPAEQRTPEAL